MKAVVLHEFGPPENLKLEEVPDPVPGADEVVIKVKACGVCGHDLIDRFGGTPRLPLPVIQGHEIAGEVLQVGAKVTGLKVGQRVAAMHSVRCGTCRYCISGRPRECRNGTGLFGGRLPGANAELFKAPSRAFTPIPDSIPYPEASILCCAIGTALHAIRDIAKVKLGETVLVTGAGGGVGVHAVQLAKLCGARVIAQTTSEGKVAMLKELGADEVICHPEGRFWEKARELTGDEGVHAVLENVGSATFENSLRSIRHGGKVVFIGNVQAAQVRFPPAVIIGREGIITGSGTTLLEELVEVVDMVAKGQVKPIVGAVYPLRDAAKVHHLMDQRKITGRVVLTP